MKASEAKEMSAQARKDAGAYFEPLSRVIAAVWTAASGGAECTLVPCPVWERPVVDDAAIKLGYRTELTEAGVLVRW